MEAQILRENPCTHKPFFLTLFISLGLMHDFRKFSKHVVSKQMHYTEKCLYDQIFYLRWLLNKDQFCFRFQHSVIKNLWCTATVKIYKSIYKNRSCPLFNLSSSFVFILAASIVASVGKPWGRFNRSGSSSRMWLASSTNVGK